MENRRTMPILPVEAYTAQDWFDREQERIFSAPGPTLALPRTSASRGSTYRCRPG